MSEQLSFYGLVTDLGKLQTELMKLKRTYPTLSQDERYQRIETSLEQIVHEYEQKNRAFETKHRLMTLQNTAHDAYIYLSINKDQI